MATGEMSFRELPCSFDDAEEALSLADWEEEYYSYAEGGQGPCYDQDLFAFSSEDFSASDGALDLEDKVIFCGKLIPCRDAEEAPTRVQEIETNNCNGKPKEAGKRSRSRLFTWRSFNKSGTSSLTAKQVTSNEEDGKTLATMCKGGRVDTGLPMRKMSILSSPLKSRWYLFAFGVGRFPMAMELSDMKTRQGKKRQANSSATKDRREMLNSSSSSSSDSSINSRTRGIWSMLNNIGCRNQQGNASFRASLGCIPSF